MQPRVHRVRGWHWPCRRAVAEVTMAKIAMILGPEFEDSEFRVPYDKLRQAGHEIVIVGEQAEQVVEGKRNREKARVHASPADVDIDEIDALVIPGGHAPDNLRTSTEIVGFVERFVKTGRPVAAVCHGPQLLIEAGVVQGRTMTSWPSVRTDLLNAGATWVDEAVVLDGNLVTSRKPDDLEMFSEAILELLSSAGRRAATG
jgi:protease I